MFGDNEGEGKFEDRWLSVWDIKDFSSGVSLTILTLTAFQNPKTCDYKI